jgi:hypothetical protein
MTNKLTRKQFEKALPKHARGALTDQMIDKINELLETSELRENYRENLLSYTSVLMEGRYLLKSYLDAVKYVSHKLLGCTNTDAYIKTFPERYSELLAQGKDAKNISNYVHAYNKNKLVNLVLEQTMIPTYILNADLHQKALNVQADLMMNAESEKVRTDAANSILTHLKVPEKNKMELEVSLKPDGVIDDLNRSTQALVEQQKRMLESGSMNAQQLAHTPLQIKEKVVEGEIVE